MPENVPQSLQQLIQDVIAPDVREPKVRVSSLEKQMDVRFDAVDQRFASVDQRFDAMEQRMDAQFKAMMAAILDWRESNLRTLRVLASLSERVAVLEAQRH